jgi:hypothetical protein
VQEEEGCPITRIYAIKSGFPVVSMGLFLIFAGLLGLLLPRMFPVGTVGILIFAGFGIFLVWLGLTK